MAPSRFVVCGDWLDWTKGSRVSFSNLKFKKMKAKIMMQTDGRWFDVVWTSKWCSLDQLLKFWEEMNDVFIPGVDMRLVVG